MSRQEDVLNVGVIGWVDTKTVFTDTSGSQDTVRRYIQPASRSLCVPAFVLCPALCFCLRLFLNQTFPSALDLRTSETDDALSNHLNPTNSALVVRGRYAGKKVVIIKAHDEGTKAHPFPTLWLPVSSDTLSRFPLTWTPRRSPSEPRSSPSSRSSTTTT